MSDEQSVVPLLVADGISLNAADPKRLRKGQDKALSDITFVIGQGEMVGLLGGRAAGKSALISVLLGESRPGAGVVYIRSQPAIISKASAFIPEETIEFNMIGLLQGSGRIGARLRPTVQRVVDDLNVAELLESQAQDCEPGDVDRIRLGTVLASAPDLIIIDDAKFRLNNALAGDNAMMEQFLAGGGSVLIAGDDPKRLGTRVKRTLWLETGRLVGDGPARVIARNFNMIVTAEQDGDRTKARQLRRRFRAAYVPVRLVIGGSGRRRANDGNQDIEN